MAGTDPDFDLHPDKPTEILCVRCGRINSAETEICRFCGHVLQAFDAEDPLQTIRESADDETVMVFNRRRGAKRYRLVLLDEHGNPLETYPIEDGTTIGRTHADILVPDQHVSRRHCQFTIRHSRLYLKDLNSTNGVFRRIRNSARLTVPAELMIGHTICRVVRKS